MGLLIDGEWHDRWYDTTSTGGRFVRKDAQFRGQITEGGPHPPEAGRYHLYVAMACPWAASPTSSPCDAAAASCSWHSATGAGSPGGARYARSERCASLGEGRTPLGGERGAPLRLLR